MKAPARALLYGLGVWGSLVTISLVLLPAEGGGHQALYESIKLTGLVGAVLGLSIRYVASQPSLSLARGALVGVAWALTCIGLDLSLYAAGAFTISLGVYFSDVASSYLVMPVITALTLGPLARRPDVAGPDAAERASRTSSLKHI